jgi:hypothetical protein
MTALDELTILAELQAAFDALGEPMPTYVRIERDDDKVVVHDAPPGNIDLAHPRPFRSTDYGLLHMGYYLSLESRGTHGSLAQVTAACAKDFQQRRAKR